MRTTSLITLAATALVSSASARINGFTLPDTIYLDADVPITITTEGYIQSVQDVSIAFGIAPAAQADPKTLGTRLLSSKFLGPDNSNTYDNITHYVHIPSSLASGDAVVTAALTSLYGAFYGPVLTYFTKNVTVLTRP
ncbi:uncharacterized protein K489DRAFT_435442 [Dissoconium aciculare CBS 342.82]|uniref:Secreted protein NIS1 n=1 Tax=Dissoconium aciculare CBS 342.82 TaxID=1314786 RepID=A0A6J3LRY2_9PEZI|nr:uncharacterized protein K489DRAFT_435442 [Dissoconium aciculare CBS 342.82]KAF1818044.1 hypothetical protein K489DRAFT_435442 [Dissoconium aciculare CBS 342.82]